MVRVRVLLSAHSASRTNLDVSVHGKMQAKKRTEEPEEEEEERRPTAVESHAGSPIMLNLKK